MKKSKAVLYATVVAVFTFILAVFIYENYKMERNSQIKLDNEKMLSYVTNEINRKISLSKSAAKALAATVEICINNEKQADLQSGDFNLIAKTILDRYEGMDRVQLIRNGLISNVYPVYDNISLLNKDVEDKIPKNVLNFILYTKECFIGGPISDSAGDKTFIVRTSIFDKNKKYWGSACIVIKINDFLKQLNLTDLSKNGYDYEFYQIHNGSNKKL